MEDKERQLRRLKFHSNTGLQTEMKISPIPGREKKTPYTLNPALLNLEEMKRVCGEWLVFCRCGNTHRSSALAICKFLCMEPLGSYKLDSNKKSYDLISRLIQYLFYSWRTTANLACHLIPHNASHLQRELKMLSQNQDENSKYKHRGHAILLPQNAKWRDYRCAPPGLVNCYTSL